MFLKDLVKNTLCFTAITIGMLYAVNALASTVYTYRDDNGQLVITNKPNKTHRQLSLIKSTSFLPYRDRKSGSTPYFSKGIKSKYDSLIINLSSKHGVEPALVKAVIHIESAFRHDAVSRVGAMGLMQLMPATAKIYQLEDNFFEPKRNMNAGIAHLKYLMNRYDNNKTLSLAAYNAGEGAVAKHKGIPPFKETQNYVTKVIKLYGKYRESFTG